MKKNEIRKMLNLEEHIDIIKIEEEKEDNINITKVYIKSNKKKVRCIKCNKFSNKIHDYLKPSKVLYLKNSEKKTYLIVHKRRFKCDECKKSFTEDLNINKKKGSISNKVDQLILKQCLDRDKTIKAIAKDNNVSDVHVRQTFIKAMKNYPNNIEYLPEVISFDETSTFTKEGMYSFILNDPINKYTIDILKSRKKDYLIKYFKKVKNRQSVKVVICDLYNPYYEVVKQCFPNSIFVADPFHYTRYVLKGLDNVRIRLEHDYESNKKSYEYLMLKNRMNSKLLLKSFNETKEELKKLKEKEQLYNEGKLKNKPVDKYNGYWCKKMKIKRNNKFIEIFRIDRLHEILEINEELKLAYDLKEEFLTITTTATNDNVKEKLEDWIIKCKDSNLEEMIIASNTINNWLNEIVNSFKDDRYSNGFTEANNNTITKIIDRAYGYKNFEFFRLRTLAILHKNYSSPKYKNSKNKEI